MNSDQKKNQESKEDIDKNSEIKQELNENEVRFKGRFPIPTALSPMKDYTFLIKGQRVEVTRHDNDDGTYNDRFVVGIIDAQLITNENNG